MKYEIRSTANQPNCDWLYLSLCASVSRSVDLKNKTDGDKGIPTTRKRNGFAYYSVILSQEGKKKEKKKKGVRVPIQQNRVLHFLSQE